MDKISTKAKAFGTFVSPTTGSILYIDPDHKDEAHHSPKLTAEEAKYAFERGLIEDPADVDTTPRTETTISKLGTERSEAAVGDLEDGALAAAPGTALDSRQTTAWPDAGRVLGGAEGFSQPDLNAPPAGNAVDTVTSATAPSGEGVGGGDDDDDSDAPPPPAPVGKPAAAKTAAAKATAAKK